MKISHKLLPLLLALALCLASLTGCGGNDNSQAGAGSAGNTAGGQEDQTGAAEDSESSQDLFIFTSNGVEIRMNAEADPVVAALGEPISTFESPSCAFQGTDYIYTYDGFQLNTYPLNDVNYVSSVVFTSDAVATAEGLEIGGTLEDMVAAYGEDYTEAYGEYTYTRGDSQLAVLIEEGTITSIAYQAVLPEQ